MKLPKISEEEFIKAYCEASDISWEELQKTQFVIECECDYAGCRGWVMVSKQLDFLPAP
jgi:hypothetical protein